MISFHQFSADLKNNGIFQIFIIVCISISLHVEMGKDVSMAGAKTVSKTLQTPKLRLFIIITTHKNNLPFQQIVLLTFFFLSFFSSL